jgi:uncharacterized protein involved in outer membrane biogenesis
MTTGLHRIPRSFWWALGISSALILALAVFLALFDWNMLRGPIAREASAMTGRQVRLDGNLAVHPWSWTPSATVDGLKIGNPVWMGGGDVADIDRLTVSVKFWPLLIGRVELPLVQAEHPTLALYRDASNRNNWRFGRSTQPAKLPPIQHFIIAPAVRLRSDPYRSRRLREQSGRHLSADGPRLADVAALSA